MEIEIYAKSPADTERAMALGQLVRKTLARSTDEVWVRLHESDGDQVMWSIGNLADQDR
jgi:hypothetical protein